MQVFSRSNVSRTLIFSTLLALAFAGPIYYPSEVQARVTSGTSASEKPSAVSAGSGSSGLFSSTPIANQSVQLSGGYKPTASQMFSPTPAANQSVQLSGGNISGVSSKSVQTTPVVGSSLVGNGGSSWIGGAPSLTSDSFTPGATGLETAAVQVISVLQNIPECPTISWSDSGSGGAFACSGSSDGSSCRSSGNACTQTDIEKMHQRLQSGQDVYVSDLTESSAGEAATGVARAIEDFARGFFGSPADIWASTKPAPVDNSNLLFGGFFSGVVPDNLSQKKDTAVWKINALDPASLKRDAPLGNLLFSDKIDSKLAPGSPKVAARTVQTQSYSGFFSTLPADGVYMAGINPGGVSDNLKNPKTLQSASTFAAFSAEYGSLFAGPAKGGSVANIILAQAAFENPQFDSQCGGNFSSACGLGQYTPATWNAQLADAIKEAKNLVKKGTPSEQQAAQELIDHVTDLQAGGANLRADPQTVAAVMAYHKSDLYDEFQSVAKDSGVSINAVAQMEHFGPGYYNALRDNPNSLATIVNNDKFLKANNVYCGYCTPLVVARDIEYRYENPGGRNDDGLGIADVLLGTTNRFGGSGQAGSGVGERVLVAENTTGNNMFKSVVDAAGAGLQRVVEEAATSFAGALPGGRVTRVLMQVVNDVVAPVSDSAPVVIEKPSSKLSVDDMVKGRTTNLVKDSDGKVAYKLPLVANADPNDPKDFIEVRITPGGSDSVTRESLKKAIADGVTYKPQGDAPEIKYIQNKDGSITTIVPLKTTGDIKPVVPAVSAPVVIEKPRQLPLLPQGGQVEKWLGDLGIEPASDQGKQLIEAGKGLIAEVERTTQGVLRIVAPGAPASSKTEPLTKDQEKGFVEKWLGVLGVAPGSTQGKRITEKVLSEEPASQQQFFTLDPIGNLGIQVAQRLEETYNKAVKDIGQSIVDRIFEPPVVVPETKYIQNKDGSITTIVPLKTTGDIKPVVPAVSAPVVTPLSLDELVDGRIRVTINPDGTVVYLIPLLERDKVDIDNPAHILELSVKGGTYDKENLEGLRKAIADAIKPVVPAVSAPVVIEKPRQLPLLPADVPAAGAPTAEPLTKDQEKGFVEKWLGVLGVAPGSTQGKRITEKVLSEEPASQQQFFTLDPIGNLGIQVAQRLEETYNRVVKEFGPDFGSSSSAGGIDVIAAELKEKTGITPRIVDGEILLPQPGTAGGYTDTEQALIDLFSVKYGFNKKDKDELAAILYFSDQFSDPKKVAEVKKTEQFKSDKAIQNAQTPAQLAEAIMNFILSQRQKTTFGEVGPSVNDLRKAAKKLASGEKAGCLFEDACIEKELLNGFRSGADPKTLAAEIQTIANAAQSRPGLLNFSELSIEEQAKIAGVSVDEWKKLTEVTKKSSVVTLVEKQLATLRTNGILFTTERRNEILDGLKRAKIVPESFQFGNSDAPEKKAPTIVPNSQGYFEVVQDGKKVISYGIGAGTDRDEPVAKEYVEGVFAVVQATDPRLTVKIYSGGQDEHCDGSSSKNATEDCEGSTRHNVDADGYSRTSDIHFYLEGQLINPGNPAHQSVVIALIKNSVAAGFGELGIDLRGGGMFHIGTGNNSDKMWGYSESILGSIEALKGTSIGRSYIQAYNEAMAGNYAIVVTPLAGGDVGDGKQGGGTNDDGDAKGGKQGGGTNDDGGTGGGTQGQLGGGSLLDGQQDSGGSNPSSSGGAQSLTGNEGGGGQQPNPVNQILCAIGGIGSLAGGLGGALGQGGLFPSILGGIFGGIMNGLTGGACADDGQAESQGNLGGQQGVSDSFSGITGAVSSLSSLFGSSGGATNGQQNTTEQSSPVVPQAVVTLVAYPIAVDKGQKVQLAWSSSGVVACGVFAPDGVRVGGGTGSGSFTSLSLARSSVFRVACRTSTEAVVTSQTTVIVFGDTGVPADTPLPAVPQI